MSSQIGPAPIAARREGGHTRHGYSALLVAAALTIQGCVAATPRPLAGPDPDNPDVRVPAAAYRSAIGGFKGMRPAEPAAWRDQSGSDKSKKDGP
jgi:hypothetical protein